MRVDFYYVLNKYSIYKGSIFPHYLLIDPVNQQVIIQLMEVFPETNMFNSGVLEIVAPSTRNNNSKISDSLFIKSSSFLCSDNE